MAKIDVCGVQVRVLGVRGREHVRAGGITPPGLAVSERTAKQLVERVGRRLPRLGYELTLCDGSADGGVIKLFNRSGKYELQGRGTDSLVRGGALRNTRSRKRRS